MVPFPSSSLPFLLHPFTSFLLLPSSPFHPSSLHPSFLLPSYPFPPPSFLPSSPFPPSSFLPSYPFPLSSPSSFLPSLLPSFLPVSSLLPSSLLLLLPSPSDLAVLTHLSTDVLGGVGADVYTGVWLQLLLYLSLHTREAAAPQGGLTPLRELYLLHQAQDLNPGQIISVTGSLYLLELNEDRSSQLRDLCICWN